MPSSPAEFYLGDQGQMEAAPARGGEEAHDPKGGKRTRTRTHHETGRKRVSILVYVQTPQNILLNTSKSSRPLASNDALWTQLVGEATRYQRSSDSLIFADALSWRHY